MSLLKKLKEKAMGTGRVLEKKFGDYIESPKGQENMEILRDVGKKVRTYVAGDGGELADSPLRSLRSLRRGPRACRGRVDRVSRRRREEAPATRPRGARGDRA